MSRFYSFPFRPCATPLRRARVCRAAPRPWAGTFRRYLSFVRFGGAAAVPLRRASLPLREAAPRSICRICRGRIREPVLLPDMRAGSAAPGRIRRLCPLRSMSLSGACGKIRSGLSISVCPAYSTITARFSSGSANRLLVSPSAFLTKRDGSMPYLSFKRL